MTLARVKAMISAASDVVMQDYVQTDGYRGYVLLQKGDIEAVIQIASESASGLGIDQHSIDAELDQIRAELPEIKTYWEKTEQSMRQNGLEEYFLRQDVKERVMTEVVKYLLDNPEGDTSKCPHSGTENVQDLTLRYAFSKGMETVLTADHRNTLARLAREDERTNQTWREPEKGELLDPKLMGFTFNQFNDFVRNLYAREYQAK